MNEIISQKKNRPEANPERFSNFIIKRYYPLVGVTVLAAVVEVVDVVVVVEAVLLLPAQQPEVELPAAQLLPLAEVFFGPQDAPDVFEGDTFTKVFVAAS